MTRRELFNIIKLAFESGYRCGAEDEYAKLDDPITFFRSEFDDLQDQVFRMAGDLQ